VSTFTDIRALARANLKCSYVDLNSYPFVRLKFSAYGHTYRTYTRVLQCGHASVGLAQPRPNDDSKHKPDSVLYRRASYPGG